MSGKLSVSVAQKLSEVAGMSSLTMKPSMDLLVRQPVTIIGVVGPAHSFVKLKSLGTQNNSHQNFNLQPSRTSTSNFNNASAGRSIWVLSEERGKEVEYGVLASSSPRYKYALSYAICD